MDNDSRFNSSRFSYPASPPPRDSRFPDDIKSPPRNVTHSIAVSTAAALNAERSALRLKNALAKTHQKPIITESRSSVSPYVLNERYSKPQMQSQTLHIPSTPLQLSSRLFGDDLQTPDQSEFGTNSGRSQERTTRSLASHHYKSVPLRRSPVGQANEKVVAFDWGPLPGVPPMSSIPTDVRHSPTIQQR